MKRLSSVLAAFLTACCGTALGVRPRRASGLEQLRLKFWARLLTTKTVFTKMPLMQLRGKSTQNGSGRVNGYFLEQRAEAR